MMLVMMHTDKLHDHPGQLGSADVLPSPIDWCTRNTGEDSDHVMVIWDPVRFIKETMPAFGFTSITIRSFVRKMYRWGFRQVSGAYSACKNMSQNLRSPYMYESQYFRRNNVALLSQMNSMTAEKRRRSAAAQKEGVELSTNSASAEERKKCGKKRDITDSSAVEHHSKLARGVASSCKNLESLAHAVSEKNASGIIAGVPQERRIHSCSEPGLQDWTGGEQTGTYHLSGTDDRQQSNQAVREQQLDPPSRDSHLPRREQTQFASRTEPTPFTFFQFQDRPALPVSDRLILSTQSSIAMPQSHFSHAARRMLSTDFSSRTSPTPLVGWSHLPEYSTLLLQLLQNNAMAFPSRISVGETNVGYPLSPLEGVMPSIRGLQIQRAMALQHQLQSREQLVEVENETNGLSSGEAMGYRHLSPLEGVMPLHIPQSISLHHHLQSRVSPPEIATPVSLYQPLFSSPTLSCGGPASAFPTQPSVQATSDELLRRQLLELQALREAVHRSRSPFPGSIPPP
jgi:HSF-type DNA-binding